MKKTLCLALMLASLAAMGMTSPLASARECGMTENVAVKDYARRFNIFYLVDSAEDCK